MIYLEFSKAFDKVDHGSLLHKMEDIVSSGVLGKWMYEFLNNRKQQVRLKCGSSHKIYVLIGVPQGTVFVPVLFLILISVYSWSAKNNMIFSDFKFQRVCFSSKKDHTLNAYKSASQNPIEKSEIAKDLGIIV